MLKNLWDKIRSLFRKPQPPASAPADPAAYEVVVIPFDARAKFCQFFDAMMMPNAGRLATYRFWAYVEQVLPGIGLGWEVYWLSHTQPAIRRPRPAPSAPVPAQPNTPTTPPVDNAPPAAPPADPVAPPPAVTVELAEMPHATNTTHMTRSESAVASQ